MPHRPNILIPYSAQRRAGCSCGISNTPQDDLNPVGIDKPHHERRRWPLCLCVVHLREFGIQTKRNLHRRTCHRTRRGAGPRESRGPREITKDFPKENADTACPKTLVTDGPTLKSNLPKRRATTPTSRSQETVSALK